MNGLESQLASTQQLSTETYAFTQDLYNRGLKSQLKAPCTRKALQAALESEDELIQNRVDIFKSAFVSSTGKRLGKRLKLGFADKKAKQGFRTPNAPRGITILMPREAFGVRNPCFAFCKAAYRCSTAANKNQYVAPLALSKSIICSLPCKRAIIRGVLPSLSLTSRLVLCFFESKNSTISRLFA